MPEAVVPGLERRLKAQLLGEVEFDAFTRGRYATDASLDQIMPIGVVAPSSLKEVEYAASLPSLVGFTLSLGNQSVHLPFMTFARRAQRAQLTVNRGGTDYSDWSD
jgi:hypothetical protein